MAQKSRKVGPSSKAPLADDIDAVVRGVVEKYGSEKRAIIQILQDLQERLRWLAPETLEAAAKELDVPPAHVYSVATFYKSFSLEPRGRHLCTVCMGTACHVRGGTAILEHFERKLGIRAGETSSNREYTLERVNCLGACALAPLAVVDGQYHGQMTETKANKLLEILTGPAE
ncbi:MAG: NAD(P)H-dependent oxidoreductase subunit E [Candidatus Aminicenantes bacterium]|nr:NAD(P)H-dependent oxidoreductase subunit E [Candidatus Aminicenantes bacterium]MCJ7484615.1 NAD(P)H-dependent oxidoreductase subunit E [Candidatus Aminicenantes bacterium]TFG56261.1 MAG: NAD(P)H-dependent oxidoreductase subunit E [Candidatus Aminicenantes bacterium]